MSWSDGRRWVDLYLMSLLCLGGAQLADGVQPDTDVFNAALFALSENESTVYQAFLLWEVCGVTFLILWVIFVCVSRCAATSLLLTPRSLSPPVCCRTRMRILWCLLICKQHIDCCMPVLRYA